MNSPAKRKPAKQLTRREAYLAGQPLSCAMCREFKPAVEFKTAVGPRSYCRACFRIYGSMRSKNQSRRQNGRNNSYRNEPTRPQLWLNGQPMLCPVCKEVRPAADFKPDSTKARLPRPRAACNFCFGTNHD